MEKSTKSFITDSLPEFITSDNPGFQQFIEAYYEFLEKNNDSESTSVKDMFKKIDGPSSLINNHNQIKDIDTTLDAFIDYFRKEIIPVSIDLAKTDKKIVLKKIRDVYLAKGTSKSFDLLFKLIYNEQVDLFETILVFLKYLKKYLFCNKGFYKIDSLHNFYFPKEIVIF